MENPKPFTDDDMAFIEALAKALSNRPKTLPKPKYEEDPSHLKAWLQTNCPYS